MSPESVSFRITRTAEDLAETVSALSHRLVRMEQRLGALEAAIEQRQSPEPAELEALAHVEVLLRDCRLLLKEPGLPEPRDFEESLAVSEDFANAA